MKERRFRPNSFHPTPTKQTLGTTERPTDRPTERTNEKRFCRNFVAGRGERGARLHRLLSFVASLVGTSEPTRQIQNKISLISLQILVDSKK